MKKFIFIIVSVFSLFILSACSFFNSLTEDKEEKEQYTEGLKFEKDTNGYAVSVGSASEIENIIIPSSYEGLPVYKIYDYGFYECKNLKNIIIPDTVKLIGHNAFSGCGLEELILPDSIEEIGDHAFLGCPTQDTIVLPPNIKRIGTEAFSGTNVDQLIIQDASTITNIAGYAFSGVKAVLVQKNNFDTTNFNKNWDQGFSYYKKNIYYDVQSYNNYTEDGTYRYFIGRGGCLNFKEPGIIINEICINDKNNGCVKLIDEINEQPVLLYDIFFESYKDKIKAMYVPEDISLSSNTFARLNGFWIDTVIFEKQIQENQKISFDKVENCLDFGYDVTSKYLWAKLADNPDGVYIIANYVDEVSELVIPDKLSEMNVIGIGSRVFQNQKFSKIVLPDGLVTIDSYAFSKCENLENIVFNDTLESIGSAAFLDCDKLETIVLPNSLKYIESNAFESCDSLKNVTLNNGLEQIGSKAFFKCNNLIEIFIPKTVIKMGKSVFSRGEDLNNGDGINIPPYVNKITIYCEVEMIPNTWEPSWHIFYSNYNGHTLVYSHQYIPDNNIILGYKK